MIYKAGDFDIDHTVKQVGSRYIRLGVTRTPLFLHMEPGACIRVFDVFLSSAVFRFRRACYLVTPVPFVEPYAFSVRHRSMARFDRCWSVTVACELVG